MNLELKWNHFVAPSEINSFSAFNGKAAKKKKLGGGGDGGWWGEVGGSLNISSLLLFHREPWHCLETVQRSSTEAY